MATVDLEPLHRFHSYCARFPSEIVETALEKYTRPGENVLDPFCGSGTTLVACPAHGRAVVGADIDVLAGMLSEVKCECRAYIILQLGDLAGVSRSNSPGFGERSRRNRYLDSKRP